MTKPNLTAGKMNARFMFAGRLCWALCMHWTHFGRQPTRTKCFPSGDSTGTVFPAYVIIGARWKEFVEINRELLTVYLPKALGIREVVPARSKFAEAMLEPTVRSSAYEL